MSGVTRWCTGGGGSMRCEGTTARRTFFLRVWWLGWARTGARAAVAEPVVLAERAAVVAVRAGAVAPAARAVAAADVAAGDVAAGDVAAGDVAAGDVAAGDVAAGDVAAGDVAAALVAGGACSVAEPHAARAPAPDVRTAARTAVVRRRDA